MFVLYSLIKNLFFYSKLFSSKVFLKPSRQQVKLQLLYCHNFSKLNCIFPSIFPRYELKKTECHSKRSRHSWGKKFTKNIWSKIFSFLFIYKLKKTFSDEILINIPVIFQSLSNLRDKTIIGRPGQRLFFLAFKRN